MLLKRIKLVNFKSHRDTELNALDLPSPLLIKGNNLDLGGSNGAGKSSIFDAIEYALYGKGNKFLRYGTDSGYVELEFLRFNKTYKIKKYFNKTDYSVEIFIDGEIKTKNKSEVDKLIRNELKISKNLFNQTIFQPQGFLTFFTGLSKSHKIEFILELLDISKWKNYYRVSVSLFNDIKKYIEAIEREVGVYRSEMLKLSEEANKLDIKKINKKLKLLQTTKEKRTEEYKTILSDKELYDNKTKLEIEINTLEDSIKNLNDELSSTITEKNKLEEVFKYLNSKKIHPVDENKIANVVTSILNMEKYISSIEGMIKEKEHKISELENKINVFGELTTCPVCLRPIDNNSYDLVKQHIESEKLKLIKEIDELKNKSDNIKNKLKERSEEHKALDMQIKVYNEHINKLSDIKVKLDNINLKYKKINDDINNKTNRLKEAKSELSKIIKIIGKNTKEKVMILYEQLQNLDQEINKLANKIETHKIYTKQLNDMKEKLNTVENSAKDLYFKKTLLEHIKFILAPDGIQKWLFMKALKEITVFTNSLIKGLGMEVIFELEKKKGVDFKPSFEIIIKKDNNLFTLDMLSGGERSLVNFALRLAFSAIMATKYDFRFIIIDEGFTDLDENKRELIANMIKHLGAQFQLFLVTHFPDFESHFSDVLLVEKSNGISYIRR